MDSYIQSLTQENSNSTTITPKVRVNLDIFEASIRLSYLGSESEPGRDAISQCLHSASPAVVDQSFCELCRLISDSKLDLSRGFLELQSVLEGSDTKFVPLFVQGLGFLFQIGFEKKNGSWKFSSTEHHPFVKILSSRIEVQSELMQQVLLFMAQNRRLGMVEGS